MRIAIAWELHFALLVIGKPEPWRTIMPIKVGDKVDGKHLVSTEERSWLDHARVIAIGEGYAMVRFKGCMPFIVTVKDLERWNPDV